MIKKKNLQRVEINVEPVYNDNIGATDFNEIATMATFNFI